MSAVGENRLRILILNQGVKNLRKFASFLLAILQALTGVCLGGKIETILDISQNSTLEKQTLHKIQ